MSEFDTDTAVTRVGEHTYEAQITDRWNTFNGTPNGGYYMATALRALGGEMPHPDPLVVSAFFLRPAVPGGAEVRTEAVRAGRRIATGEATMSQNGKDVLRVISSFGDLEAGGRTLVLDKMPELPAPEECIDPVAGVDVSGVSIAERVAFRMPTLPGWMSGTPGGQPSHEFWMRFADGREPDTLALPALVDAAPPAVLDIGEFATATVELTVHLRARPAPGWLACRIATRYVINGLHEEDFEIWDSTGTLVAQSRQLALLG